ncbi:PREDICTED: uncharacterized protein LOC106126092 [Papilio xuthus]|uniref:Uncharacterized protein LOC106126092 n=1 Tax=Papilio xuthus TaxID=66420 RepID=A0AAJ6ZU01_PAPXU|nr:PREDICTED: uncharacterized protein LOC106126092 [Papilio xuthus]
MFLNFNIVVNPPYFLWNVDTEMAQGKRRWRFLVSEAKTHLGSLPQRTKFGANEPREHQGDQQHTWTSTMPEDPLMRCCSEEIRQGINILFQEKEKRKEKENTLEIRNVLFRDH